MTVIAAAIWFTTGVSFEKTLRFVNSYINEEGTLELSLTTARPLYHGRRIGAFHRERKPKPYPQPPAKAELGEPSAEPDA